ncbi:MAG: FG-GAP-like repeat-containing protein, partial [Nitrospira sp.]|nr:FG-GAP-like repeat-containing protein [Nitrospira sp.]
MTLQVPAASELVIIGMAFEGDVQTYESHDQIPALAAGVSRVISLNLLPKGELIARMILEPLQVDTSSEAQSGDRLSGQAVFSGDNRRVVFTSLATNLVSEDNNGYTDVFLKNLVSGAITNIHTDSTGQAANGEILAVDMSLDGRTVVFSSNASNLVPGDNNGQSDVFVKYIGTDDVPGDTQRLSVTGSETEISMASGTPTVSADGRNIALHSDGSLLSGEGPGGIFLLQRHVEGGMDIRYVGPGILPALSGDGLWLIFRDGSAGALMLHDVARNETREITRYQAGETPRHGISDNGRYVVFASNTDFDPADTDEGLDVYRYDRVDHVLYWLSTDRQGAPLDGAAANPSLSDDGRYVAFNINSTIFLKDAQTGEAVSLPEPGYNAVISPNGQLVAYNRGSGDSLFVSANPLFVQTAPNTEPQAPQQRPVPEFVHRLQVTVVGSGVVTSDDDFIGCGVACSHTYGEPTTVVLTATALADAVFTGWGGFCAGSEAQVTVSVAGARNCVANFQVQTAQYSIGGTISGLAGSGLVLLNNGGDILSVNAGATGFTFASPMANGSAYLVTVGTQPVTPNQTCLVGNGSGSVAGGPVTSVSISCENFAPVLSDVHISDGNGGSVAVGDELTVMYVYFDSEAEAEGATTYAWRRNDVPIEGATGKTYTVVSADSNQVLTVTVTPAALSGTSPGAAVTSSGALVGNSAPIAMQVGIIDVNGGTPVVGDVLTGTYVYGDAENDPQGNSSFRWLRNGAAIAGATKISYTVTSADSGQTLVFEVVPRASVGTVAGNAAVAAGLVILNSPPMASEPVIVDVNGGGVLVGDSLTGSYLYSDLDGDAQGASTFRWLRNGSAITGAAAKTYTVAVADSGATLTFEVTPVAATGTAQGSPVVSTGLAVGNNPPVASNVTIVDASGGSAVVGDVLTGNYVYNDTESDVEGASTYRWLRNGSAITRAAAKTYTVAIADSGATLTFEVTPVAATGTAQGSPVVSAGLTVGNNAPVASNVGISDNGAVVIRVGGTLTGIYTYADAESDPQGVSTYRWLRNGSPIAGETGLNHLIVAADSGQKISFEVTPVATSGTKIGAAVASQPVTVLNSPPETNVSQIVDNQNNPVTNGSMIVGDVLFSYYTYFDADGDAEGISTYRWLRNNTAIAGATGRTYTVVLADRGQPLSFEVTPVDAKGNSGPATSSTVVFINNPPTATAVSIAAPSVIGVGTALTGSYQFNDADGDLQGNSSYRWLRDNIAIAGATALSYSVVAADVGAALVFEVTPVSQTGDPAGFPIRSAEVRPGMPVVSRLARYLDINRNGIHDAGDQIVVPFSLSVTVKLTSGSAFAMPVTGDSLGTGATLSSGPQGTEVTITLGTAPKFRVNGGFLPGVTAANSPSAIDISALMAPNAIEGVTTGIDAVPSTPVDIVPAYVDAQQLLSTNAAYDVNIGDLDLDGDLDIVEVHGPNGFQVWLNDGAAGFSAGQAFTTYYTEGVAIGDVNGDGKLDLVSAHRAFTASPEGDRVWLNQGNATFLDSAQSLGLEMSNGITLGDLDKDGDLDYVVATQNGNKVWINDGLGMFSDSGQSMATIPNLSVALADVNGDTHLDQIVILGDKGNMVWINDGLGKFTDSGQLLGAGLLAHQVTVGDVDKDGDPDMVIGNHLGGGIRLWLNDGAGKFSGNNMIGPSTFSSSLLSDFDGDNDLDLVITSRYVWLNNGNGQFGDSWQFAQNAGGGFAMGDLDNDGDLDLVSYGSTTWNQIWLNS